MFVDKIAFGMTLIIIGLIMPACSSNTENHSQDPPELPVPGFRTNTAKRSIELSELQSGGVPRDGIPAIDEPKFVSIRVAREWVKPQEPVISLVVRGKARAYPLQILVWHEIANDEIAGVPVAVTFCPLCYSALVFKRTVSGKVYRFGVSGMLRNSDLVMYDRQTESLWQQLDGTAIVGDMLGTQLEQLPSQIISFAQFEKAYPDGEVLSAETGHIRSYGSNPYPGYDDINQRPYLYQGEEDPRLPPMEKVITVIRGNDAKAYAYTAIQKVRVIHDTLDDHPIVVFHAPGALSALHRGEMASSREVGSTGVFEPLLDGQTLTFTYSDGFFVDTETGSSWDVTGRAVSGSLKDKQLTPIPHGDFFAFAWLAFRPDSGVYK